jgi:hypothetical protein
MAFMDYMPQFGQNTTQQPPSDDLQMQMEMKRRMAFADSLRNQQMPQGEMVSGRYVAPSWTQQLANVFGKYVAGKVEDKALGQYRDYAKTKAEKQAEALKSLSGAIAPTAVTENSTYDIQVPNGRTPQTENLGGMQPYESGMKNISVPVTNTTGQRNRTSAELLQAVADYAAATKDPAMYEKLVMGQVSKSLEPKQTDWKALEGKFYGFDMQGNPTGKVLGEGKKETPGTLQKDFEYAKSQGYKGSVEDFKRIANSYITPYQSQQLANEARKENPLGIPNLSGPQRPLTNSKGWALHTDAKGNQAYVSPDGKSFEEAK